MSRGSRSLGKFLTGQFALTTGWRLRVFLPKMFRPSKSQWSLYVPSHSTILRSAHMVYLCVLCGYENKLRLFPHTTLTGFYNRNEVCLLRGTD